jgi:hypothetical protein
MRAFRTSHLNYRKRKDSYDTIGIDFYEPTRAIRMFSVQLIFDHRNIIGSLFPEWNEPMR